LFGQSKEGITQQKHVITKNSADAIENGPVPAGIIEYRSKRYGRFVTNRVKDGPDPLR